jgi:hypothetical protein
MNPGLRSRYQDIAERLTIEAESGAHVSVYITAEDVAEALGDKHYDREESPLDSLKEWIADRRLLGFEPTADDILDWVADQTTTVEAAA